MPLKKIQNFLIINVKRIREIKVVIQVLLCQFPLYSIFIAAFISVNGIVFISDLKFYRRDE